MVLSCPKCGRTVPDDSLYCPYCAQGLKPSAITPQVSVGGILMLVAAASSLVISVLSIRALLEIYSWYPQLIAQKWFFYDQLLTGFSFAAFIFGLLATTLSLIRRNYRWTMIAAVLCMLSGGGVWITSMLVPDYKPLNSILYYFLPTFLSPLIGTLLFCFRRPEFK